MRKWQVLFSVTFLFMAVPAFADSTAAGASIWDQLIMTALTLFGGAITTFLGWLTKKGTDWLKARTTFLAEQTKNALQARIIETVTIATRETMQTYVDAIKAASADGTLTKEEKEIALNKTFNRAVELLKQNGLEAGELFLTALIEATVNMLKGEKNVPGPSPTPE